ncbi:unnamed protein product, partial [Brachionus calyciflorus]
MNNFNFLLFFSLFMSLSSQQCSEREIKCENGNIPEKAYCYKDHSRNLKKDVSFYNCYNTFIKQNPLKNKEVRIEFSKIHAFSVDFNFLSSETEQFYVWGSDFSVLLETSKLTKLNTYSFTNSKLTKLESNYRLPLNVKIIDFSNNKIEFISEN